MSVCAPCQKAEDIPNCLENLEIGTISDVDTDVYIYIKDITSDNQLRFERTSSAAGLVTLTGLDSEDEFMPAHSYELWITLKSATSIEDRETITIGLDTVECIALTFIKVKVK